MKKLILLVLCFSFFSAKLFAQCSTCLVHITPGPVDTLCNTQKLNWAKWTSIAATTATGTISSTLSVTCTQATGGMFATGGMYNGGVFPVQYSVPVGTTAIANSKAGVFTLCFSRPVVNPQIALASIGSGGQTVQINTSVPYCVIWQGQSVVYYNDTSFAGTEGFTIIRFPGIHTCISFNYLQNEYYWNLAFGVQDTSCQVPAPVLCKGEQVTLNASGGSNYIWSPATGLNKDTGAVVVASPSVTTRYYCTDGICTDSVLVTVGLPAVVTKDTAVCFGNFVQLEASGGSIYKWSPSTGLSDPDIPNPVAFPLATTSYTVTISPTPCTDSMAVVNIAIYPTPPIPFINQGHDTLFCSTDPVYDAYQWYYNSQPIAGATDSFYVAQETGNYNVAVTDTNGCMISVGINIVVLGSSSFAEDHFSIMPNPAGNTVTVSSSTPVETVDIYDMMGQRVFRSSPQDKRPAPLVYNIHALAPGIYVVQLQTAAARHTIKFVKE